MSESNDANYTILSNSPSNSDPTNLLTQVGAFVLSPAPYGTYDMGGDVQQWTESIYKNGSTTFHQTASGGYDENSSYLSTLGSNIKTGQAATASKYDLGFRVAASVEPVPEPHSITIVVAGAVGLVLVRGLRSGRKCRAAF